VDTIKILLAAVVALLLGALVMSWKNFRHEEKNAPPAELAKVREQIEEIRTEQERLRSERERILYGTPPKPAPAEAEPGGDPGQTASTLEEGQGSAVSPEMTPATGTEAEPPVLPPAGKSPEERAKVIQAAPAVAKIAEWVEDKDIGSFATIQILIPDRVKADTMLCVRRNSGILGRLKVGDISPEGAIANAVSLFTGPKPQPGDELILEPPAE
jgi:hypothetical protein